MDSECQSLWSNRLDPIAWMKEFVFEWFEGLHVQSGIDSVVCVQLVIMNAPAGISSREQL